MTELLDFVLLAVLAVYLIVLAYVTVYCFVQLYLLVAYLRGRRAAQPTVTPELPHWPAVTVQIPLYNERYVATRIIDAVCAFDYPRELLQIQVLDDSTDATVDIVADRVAAWRARGGGRPGARAG